jgi:hypothetical protein
MTTLEIKKSDYIISEFKSWLWILALLILSIIAVRALLHWQFDKIWLLITVIIISKLGDTITQYHADKVMVDKFTNNLHLIFRSIMSGEKQFNFPLDKVESRIIPNGGFQRLISGPIALEINASGRKRLRITKRYGFSSDGLRKIHELIQGDVKT